MTQHPAEARRLSISNIAWPQDDDPTAIALVASLDFQGVELAPAKVFGSLAEVTSAEVRAYRGQLAAAGLAVPALQGILFGLQGAHLFTDDGSRRQMALHLRRVAEIAAELGASACVFGAPTLRDPGGLPADAAWRIAADFFATAAADYARLGTALCLEANPPLYGCKFVTRTPEALSLVEAVGHPGLALQLDTGTILINGEPPGVIVDAGSRIGHFHVSEPSLAPVGATDADHRPLAAALRASDYQGWASIEMKAVPDWAEAVRRAHGFVARTYLSA